MSQIETIKQRLQSYSEVSRNWAIREQYITRLSGIIDKLEKQGWEFTTENRGGDYVYKLVKMPKLSTDVYSEDYIKMTEQQYHNPKML